MLVVLASSARDNVLDQGFSTQPLVDTPSLLHAPQDLMSFKWACTNGHDEQGEAVTYVTPLRSLASSWHRSGHPVPIDYLNQDAQPTDPEWRSYQSVRWPGDGRRPTLIEPHQEAPFGDGGWDDGPGDVPRCPAAYWYALTGDPPFAVCVQAPISFTNPRPAAHAASTLSPGKPKAAPPRSALPQFRSARP